MFRRVATALAAAAALAVLAFGAAAPQASAARNMQVGIFDDAQFLYGDPGQAFATAAAMHTQVVRVTLHWGGRFGVARRRPAAPENPNDRAYNWDLYDRAVQYANQYGIKVMFSIVGTPAWENGGKGENVAPRRPQDLAQFATAAALRYSGTWVPRGSKETLPAVRLWLAWNEPNNPVFLKPQFKRVGKAWRFQSAYDYAKICQAVYDGVHGTYLDDEQVGCGVTSPRGNNNPNSSRPSEAPLAFLRALAKAAPKLQFDAYAHHPYYGQRSEQPDRSPPTAKNGHPATAITLGNIGTLISTLTDLYGKKPLWITEYGYQTDPPDKVYGVTWAQQARYLTTAYRVMRANPRIELMIWFLLRDDSKPSGWQSGFYTDTGRKKPSYAAFQKVALQSGSKVGLKAPKKATKTAKKTVKTAKRAKSTKR